MELENSGFFLIRLFSCTTSWISRNFKQVWIKMLPTAALNQQKAICLKSLDRYSGKSYVCILCLMFLIWLNSLFLREALNRVVCLNSLLLHCWVLADRHSQHVAKQPNTPTTPNWCSSMQVTLYMPSSTISQSGRQPVGITSVLKWTSHSRINQGLKSNLHHWSIHWSRLLEHPVYITSVKVFVILHN